MSKHSVPRHNRRNHQPAARGRELGPALAERIRARTRSPQFRKYLTDLLLELCAVDTTPRCDPELMRTAEEKCFQILERELSGLRFANARTERRPVNPVIQKHPNYSRLHFTKTGERPQGLPPEQVYAKRANLVFMAPGTNAKQRGQSLALNAHIDVVAPYLPSRSRKGVVFGRGACDDKGPLVGIIGALKVLSEVLAEHKLELNRNVVGMFVVEEETGGNGSLSLAIDRDLKRSYDSIMVCECTGLKVHPANRGAVWYKAELKPPAGVSAFEMFAFVNEELEKEGTAIRAESRHELFPQRPVQTCHGIIGPFGEHPSRICGHVCFQIRLAGGRSLATDWLVRDCLDSGLAGYLGLYGDKSKVTDPATGKPMVPVHYRLEPTVTGYKVDVYGATGHMGAIRERDGAITKCAHLLRALIASRMRITAFTAGAVSFELDSPTPAGPLVLEGGQGFVPTHPMDTIMSRLGKAAARGAEAYLRVLGRTERGYDLVNVTYEKLHNVAFDGDPKSESMRNAEAAAKTCGLWTGEPMLGWTVSCDARLFATEYRGMQVLTFGPGQLAHAHSDREQIMIEDVQKAADFLALFILKQTGTDLV